MKIFVDTMGCPKNLSDTQMFEGILIEKGNNFVEEPIDADCIIVNTCGFINDAKIESIDKIFEMSKYNGVLVVTGCLTQRYGNELMDEIPEIDLCSGVNNYIEISEILSKISKEISDGREIKEIKESIKLGEYQNKRKLIDGYKKENDFYMCEEKLWKTRKLSDRPWTSTIKISEGCNNNCAYCVIPSIRGKYRSRKPEDIIAEAKHLAMQGVKELILIGQDTTNYGKDFSHGENSEFNTLGKLIKALCKIEKLEWIRLMYCYEDKIDEELIEVIANEEKVCNYLDIPLQHSSNNILKGMKRKSTEESIKKTLGSLREKVEDIHIRTTFIVGFPGETEEDFDKLYDFIEEEKFERLGVFAYSQEENTVAGEMENQIDDDIKEERKNSVMNLQMEVSLERNRRKVGEVLEVLIEEQDEENTYIGRSRFDAPEIDNGVIVRSDRPLNLGEIVKVKIEDGFDYDIVGTAIDQGGVKC